MNTLLFNTTKNTGSEQQQQQQMDAQEQTTSPDSEDYKDKVVQPTPTNLPSLDVALMGSPDAWSMAGGDAHAGLEVYTVGHFMPHDGSFVDGAGNWSAHDSRSCSGDTCTGHCRGGSRRSTWCLVFWQDADAWKRGGQQGEYGSGREEVC
jgi:hypothetical protein